MEQETMNIEVPQRGIQRVDAAVRLIEVKKLHEQELLTIREELRLSQRSLEKARDRYADLYDFAPTGYLTLTSDGLISEINLTGAGFLLGEVPKEILHCHFTRFVAREDRGRFKRMRRQLVKPGERGTCAVALQRTDQSIFHAQLDCVCVETDDPLAPAVRITVTDISERKEEERAIETLAFYDPLTNLPNRRLLMDRLQHATLASARTERQGAVLFVDLDNLKTLNDTQGHGVGDLLLKQAAHRMTACVRESDTVARLGGDEFVVILEELSGVSAKATSQARAVGEKIIASLSKRYWFGSQEYRSTGSIGMTLFGTEREPPEDLLRHADLALYQAKAAGGGVVRVFAPEMQNALAARLTLEHALRRGLQEDQFVLYYQPQVDRNGHLTGAEALLRWRHPSGAVLLPEEFIPLAEERGLIIPLGRLVLETACKQLVLWSADAGTAHLDLAINVSAHEFGHRDFVDHTLRTIARIGANPERIMIEITESLMLSSIDGTIAKLSALKTQGLRFSLDDFGIGYSSLMYLKHLPLDQIKIDRSFVRDVLTSAHDAAIATTIISLGNSLDLAVIAEGVETEDQRSFLTENGCNAFQGFLFGRPRPVEELRPETWASHTTVMI